MKEPIPGEHDPDLTPSEQLRAAINRGEDVEMSIVSIEEEATDLRMQELHEEALELDSLITAELVAQAEKKVRAAERIAEFGNPDRTRVRRTHDDRIVEHARVAVSQLGGRHQK